MKLKDFMTPNVEAISANATLVEAANMMARLDIGFLPVLDGDVAGVITDRDIVIRAIADGRNPSETKVQDVFTADVAVLSEDQDVSDAAELMQNKKIRRILVKNATGAYVGVVSLGDVAVDGHASGLCGEAMEKVCTP
jgi:CBS domain-containing protein